MKSLEALETGLSQTRCGVFHQVEGHQGGGSRKKQGAARDPQLENEIFTQSWVRGGQGRQLT